MDVPPLFYAPPTLEMDVDVGAGAEGLDQPETGAGEMLETLETQQSLEPSELLEPGVPEVPEVQKRKRKKRKDAGGAAKKPKVKEYLYEPPEEGVPWGSAWFKKLAQFPVQSISPTPKDKDIRCARYVLYDVRDRTACVFVQLNDQSQRYLQVPTKQVKGAMNAFKTRLAGLQLPVVVPESADYLSLKQIQNMLAKFAETSFNAKGGGKKQGSKSRGKTTAEANWEACMDVACQLTNLLEQFALQGGCLMLAQAGAGEPNESPSRAYGDREHDPENLLLEQRMAKSLFAATLENAPWFVAQCANLIPTKEAMAKMLELETKAKTKSRMSAARKEYEEAYTELVAEQEKKKRARTKKLQVEDPINWVSELTSAQATEPSPDAAAAAAAADSDISTYLSVPEDVAEVAEVTEVVEEAGMDHPTEADQELELPEPSALDAATDPAIEMPMLEGHD